MSKEGFNWKGLFINNDEESEPKQNAQRPEIKADVNKFPEQTNFVGPNTTQDGNNPFMDEILQVYNSGFDSLNLADFDFFEMYKSVIATGSNNPQSYQMAFTIGKSIKPDLTKEYLLEKSKFYINEIEKVYTKYRNIGNSKKLDLDNSINTEKTTLTSRIAKIESELAALQQELERHKASLNKLGSQNQVKFNEIQLKLDANDYARKRILDSLNLVISDIKQYL